GAATIFGNWIDGAGGVRTAISAICMRALATAPAVVAALDDAIDLFPGALPHIPQPQLIAARVETPAPGIAQAIGVDLRTVVREVARVHTAERIACEGIAAGDAIGNPAGSSIHIDAQHLSQQRRQALAVADLAPGIAAT